MLNLYGKIVWINLLDNRKRQELQLINWFESLIKKFQDPNHRYIYYNFHHEWELDKENKGLETKLKVGGIAKYMKFFQTRSGQILQQ